MNTTVNDRVRKYRRKLSDGNCGRLEVWLGNNLIEAIRTIARHQNRYVWAVVKDALVAHVSRHASIVAAGCKHRD
jgi:hypothetical protein